MENNIKCIIMKNNLKVEVYNNVRIITLKSKTDTLVIMKDYWPIVGEFFGKISLELTDDSITFDDVDGFYFLSNNIFRFIMKEENNVK